MQSPNAPVRDGDRQSGDDHHEVCRLGGRPSRGGNCGRVDGRRDRLAVCHHGAVLQQLPVGTVCGSRPKPFTATVGTISVATVAITALVALAVAEAIPIRTLAVGEAVLTIVALAAFTEPFP